MGMGATCAVHCIARETQRDGMIRASRAAGVGGGWPELGNFPSTENPGWCVRARDSRFAALPSAARVLSHRHDGWACYMLHVYNSLEGQQMGVKSQFISDTVQRQTTKAEGETRDRAM
ncbi:hypothetical protein GGP41_004800 [Bipolaris sorokiniana]|uniref:Uncharacterized protein n=1 Tax=Cochliobolus sativus TaxID=45130 RepID=A0A8H6DSU7_COCSA|nr:hypothetical protein GGP41_004800 [Bipolaris sorokiniana]